jgi:hypothetical protein
MNERLLTFADLEALGLPFTRQHLARLERANGSRSAFSSAQTASPGASRKSRCG